MTDAMHLSGQNPRVRNAIFHYASDRIDVDPPLDGPRSMAELTELAGQTITEQGLGGEAALKLFEEVLAPATISTDHPNYLSFIPTAPTELSTMFDLVVSASSIYGGSWKEGAGAVYAENQVLSFLAAECGLPATSGGLFVQGGTLGNLSALVAAREKTKAIKGKQHWAIICSSEAHSSIKSVAKVMDCEVVIAEAGESGSLGKAAAQAAVVKAKEAGLTPFAIVGTAGTTNFGIVDDLQGISEVAKANELWFHVDGAYGLAGILAPELKHLYKGVENADSFIVDPHKWLFAPFDACALVYREPEYARLAHTQHGEYLEVLTKSDEFNPSDYGFNLTRRVRGLPLWFSMASHGAELYRQAISANVKLTHRIAKEIASRNHLKLVRDPQLSVVVFERVGWELEQYEAWSEKLLSDQFAFVVPSSHLGKPNTRFAIVNPLTKYEDLVKILDSME